LIPLLRRGDGAGREEELAALLIPLLASRRPRVFEAARLCLEALTGEHLGDTPERWLVWYERPSGHRLDMRGAGDEGPGRARPRAGGGFRILGEDEELASTDDLRTALAARVRAARQQGLSPAASIQLPDERLAEFDGLLRAPDVAPLMELLMDELGFENVVV